MIIKSKYIGKYVIDINTKKIFGPIIREDKDKLYYEYYGFA